MVTKEIISLIELTEKHANTDFIRELGKWTLHRLMELEVESQVGAGKHERSDDRVAHRNGYRERALETRVGTMNLKIPKLRSGSYYPSFLDPRRRSEQALVSVIQQAYIEGVSTRKVDDLVQSMGMSGISKSQVSRFCLEMDGKVQKFLGRSIDGQWPYIWLDATYLKSREDGQVTSRAVVIAAGVNSEGRRDILGLSVGPGESEAFWMDFLRSLKERGPGGVKLVISDAHKGLRKAIDTVMCASWQRCRVHFMRNVLAHVPKRQRQMVASLIRTVFDQPTQAEASTQWRAVADQLRGKFRKLGELMDVTEEEVLTFMSFPTEHRRQIASTNNLERLNKEIKRRANVVGIFPDDGSVIRLIGAVAMEQSEEWRLTCRYMSQESLSRVLHGDGHTVQLENISKEEVA